MSKIEILAPVGSEEMLLAAVFSGADAVYLGFSGFNARTGAGNFDADSLKEAVRFCHARGVAVHVALNTTVYGTELPALEQAIRSVAASGADAVICHNDIVAQGAASIALELGRKPGADLMLSGEGDYREFQEWHPAVTTSSVDYAALTERLCELIELRTAGRAGKLLRIELPTLLLRP